MRAHNLKLETNRQPETKTKKSSLASEVLANVVFLVKIIFKIPVYTVYLKSNNVSLQASGYQRDEYPNIMFSA